MTEPDITDAIRELFYRRVSPVVFGLDTSARDEREIEAQARALADDCMELFFQGHLPYTKRPRRTTPESLEKLARRLRVVEKDLSELPERAGDLIQNAYDRDDPADRSGPPDLWYLRDEIARVARLAEKAHRAVKSGPAPGMPQKPKKTAARAIAARAVIVYEALTGKKATRSVHAYVDGQPEYGPFVDFLNDLFEALEVEASAENYAKEAIAGRKTPGPDTLPRRLFTKPHRGE
jgi:hypothetical protein